MSCAGGGGATVHLDGSQSYDRNSSPGTNDDIVLFEWFEDFGLPSQALLGTGEILDVLLPAGTHVITLRVTDGAAATDTDTKTVSVFATAGEAGPLEVLKLGLDGWDLGLRVSTPADPCATAVRFYRGTLPIDVDQDGDMAS